MPSFSSNLKTSKLLSMSKKISAESLASTTDDEEIRLDRISLQASLSRIEFRPKNNIILPEDIAAVAFSRLFNEELGSTTDPQISPKTPIARSHGTADTRQQRLESIQTRSCMGHGTQKQRHKSPANRPHSIHPPSSMDGISNWDARGSVRKTKSTALPARIRTTWPRSASASTPEFKVDEQGVVIERLPSTSGSRSNRRVYLVRTMCYYNFRLIYIILNCCTLVTGLVYLGSGIALWMHKEVILIIVDYRLYISSIICVFGLALLLLAVATCGLCLVQTGPKRTAASKFLQHAGCSLVMGVVLVAISFWQSAAQSSVEVDAEFRMLSIIQPELTIPSIWDHLHHDFKCCGVRGYFDWCQKVNVNTKIYTSAEDFLGSFTCNLPESCCTSQKLEFGVSEDTVNTSCVFAPTPSNTHRSGCLTPMLVVITYLGKMFRIGSFVTAFILLLTTTTSMILFTYL